MASIYMPYIIERSSRGERTYDIFSRGGLPALDAGLEGVEDP